MFTNRAHNAKRSKQNINRKTNLTGAILAEAKLPFTHCLGLH